MRAQYEALQKQSDLINQYEKLFDDRNCSAYAAAREPKAKDTEVVPFLEQASDAFDAFNFSAASESDGRGALVVEGKALLIEIMRLQLTPKDLKKYTEELNSEGAAFRFFDMVTYFVANLPGNNDTSKADLRKAIIKLHGIAKRLIAAQKTALEAALSTAKKNMEQEETALKAAIKQAERELPVRNAKEKTTARIAFAKKTAYYSGITTLGLTGLSATVGSALLQFSPAFAVMVGVHLPVVALASIAVTGLAMTAVAAYMAYRAYKPAQAPGADAADAAETKENVTATDEKATGVDAENAPVVTANPKLVAAINYSLIASGVGLMGFSGAMFSPKVALMLGLHLSPAVLAGIAAVGVLLLSVALYRMCKNNAQTPAPEAQATDAETITCMQRLSQYGSACLKFFKKADKQGNDEKKGADNVVDSTATTLIV